LEFISGWDTFFKNSRLLPSSIQDGSQNVQCKDENIKKFSQHYNYVYCDFLTYLALASSIELCLHAQLGSCLTIPSILPKKSLILWKPTRNFFFQF
jgi:hypothetical protein